MSMRCKESMKACTFVATFGGFLCIMHVLSSTAALLSSNTLYSLFYPFCTSLKKVYKLQWNYRRIQSTVESI